MAITINGDGTITGISAGGLPDNSVQTADIADDQITLAKMAGGTDGQIITYDASGNPVAVGPGSDGQVLTSTGAGSPPAFEAAPAGALVFVGEQTLSGSTDTTINVEDTALFDGTYDQVLLRITDHHPNTDESMFIARGKYGGSYQTTSHYIYNSMIFYEDSYAYMSAGSAAANNHPAFRLGKQIGNAAGESFCCDFWIDSPADTVNYKLFRWYPTYVRTSVQIMHGFGAGMYTNSTTGQGALQGVQFGNFDSGASAAQLKDIKIRKYGFKKS